MMMNISTWGNWPKRGRSGRPTPVIAAISLSSSVLVVGVIASAVITILRQKHKFGFSNEAISSISPVRYSYSQIKKFTNNFDSKLGEGEFGTVYRGTIHQSGLDISVAVKILKRSRQTKKQFMSEVATTGSIHHHNLVSNLGYCFEGDTHALVYEFVENGSLDRYICNIKDNRLCSKQVYNILMDIARGILYLHKGCHQKILHCGIKPPNILLDSKYVAKVSDFGLAKTLEKDRSHFSLTRAQGTPGYSAPEMWLKTLGPVSEKSDVYSYGMLLLEMVGRRKNYDTAESGTSKVYFPEWLYNKIESEELPILMRQRDCHDSSEITEGIEDSNDEDAKAIQRMCLVGLWCIQHIPSKRPSMSKVVKMLEGHVEIGIPPHPFQQSTGIIHGKTSHETLV